MIDLQNKNFKDQNEKKITTNDVNKDMWETLRGITQLIRFWICSLNVTNLSLTNLMVTRGLHGR
jgi:hypothetical protein